MQVGDKVAIMSDPFNGIEGVIVDYTTDNGGMYRVKVGNVIVKPWFKRYELVKI